MYDHDDTRMNAYAQKFQGLPKELRRARSRRFCLWVYRVRQDVLSNTRSPETDFWTVRLQLGNHINFTVRLLNFFRSLFAALLS